MQNKGSNYIFRSLTSPEYTVLEINITIENTLDFLDETKRKMSESHKRRFNNERS